MIKNLESLKDDYLLTGGEDPEFVTKVQELENFLKYRKTLAKPVEQPKPAPNHPVAQPNIQQQPSNLMQ